MGKLGLALAFGVLAAGTVAHAQTGGGSISNIQHSASTTVILPGFDTFNFGPGAGVAATTETGGPPGTSYNSFVTVGDSAITFESSNAGQRANTSSTSSVSFDVTNNTHQAVNFNSTITAAGLGFYLADTSANGGNCLYTGCPQATGHTFGELLGGQTTVGFNFSVTSTVPGGSDPALLYSLNGSMQLNSDGLFRDLGTSAGPTSPATGAASLLNFGTTLGDDFNSQLGARAASAIGYAWDATDISFGIGAFANQTLTYSTTVFSNSNSSCIANTAICLVAYSGFGDPVGRGGDITDFLSLNNVSGLRGTITSFAGLGGLINGINFGPSTFNLPTFSDGGVNFQETGVPEPATWTMMIAGFGLLGAALRRRRVLAYN
jgi:hypothetical protein